MMWMTWGWAVHRDWATWHETVLMEGDSRGRRALNVGKLAWRRMRRRNVRNENFGVRVELEVLRKNILDRRTKQIDLKSRFRLKCECFQLFTLAFGFNGFEVPSSVLTDALSCAELDS